MLLRRGRPVSLTPRVFDTLIYFVRHRGRVLGKEELTGALWPDAFVEENNLTQNVSTLRRALGEARGEHRYIVTVPGHGHRFAPDVKAVAGGTTSVPEAVMEAAPEPSPGVIKIAGEPGFGSPAILMTPA